VLALGFMLPGCGSRSGLDVSAKSEPRDSAPADSNDGAVVTDGAFGPSRDATADTSFEAAADALLDTLDSAVLGADVADRAEGNAADAADAALPPPCTWTGYAPEVTYPLGSPLSEHPTSIAAGDFNHDGHVDLAATAFGEKDTVSVYINKGDGTFEDQVIYPMGRWPEQIATADFDGDGFIDIAISSLNPCFGSDCQSSIAILRNLGDGTFSAPTFVPSGGIYANALVVGDMNGDQRPDLVVTNDPDPHTTFAVILNRGHGAFDAPVTYALGLAQSVTLGDLDGNGTLDVVLGIFSRSAAQLATFFNDGTGSLTQGPTYTYGPDAGSSNETASSSIAIGDFAGTGHNDLVATDPLDRKVLWFSNPGSGVLGTPSSYGVGAVPGAMVSADFDGDGTLDVGMNTFLYTAEAGAVDTVTVLRNMAHRAFAPPAAYQEFASTGGITTADLNGDGHPDFAVGNTSWISVLLSECK
jgi:hypothetical protein